MSEHLVGRNSSEEFGDFFLAIGHCRSSPNKPASSLFQRYDFAELPAATLFRWFAGALDRDMLEPILRQHVPQTCLGLPPDSVFVRRRRDAQTHHQCGRRGLRELEERDSADGLDWLGKRERRESDLPTPRAEREKVG